MLVYGLLPLSLWLLTQCMLVSSSPSRAKSFEPPGCFNPLSLPVARPHDVNMINEGKVDRGRHELSAELRQEVAAYVRRVLNGTELLDRYEQYL